MSAAVTIPSMGVGMTEALLVRWCKEPGDLVEVDDVVAEIETDKTTIELSSPIAGRLAAHQFAEGEEVPVGAAIVEILDRVERAPHGAAAATPTMHVDPRPAPDALRGPAERPPHTLSPRARKRMAEQPTTPMATPTGRFRAAIAAKVSESWATIPHFAVEREIEMDGLLALKDALSRLGTPVTVTDLLVRALAVAVVPATAGPVDLAVAVASDHGVTAPVITDVLSLAPHDLTTARAAAVTRGRTGRLVSADLCRPATTLSNLGPHGVDRFTGIIAGDQTTLVTVGRVRPRAVVANGELVVRTTMFATVNADHRALDGADAAGLLARFAYAIETPDGLTRQGAWR